MPKSNSEKEMRKRIQLSIEFLESIEKNLRSGQSKMTVSKCIMNMQFMLKHELTHKDIDR